MHFHIFEDASVMSEGTAAWIAAFINQTLRSKPTFSLLLSGGSTPKNLYNTITREKSKYNINWQKVNIFFGDERFVPFNDERNNGKVAYDLLLKPSGIPDAQIHFIDTSISGDESASRYEKVLRNFFANEGVTFDLALLGIGNDGHTLSLFPGKKDVFEYDKWVIASEAPEEPVQRISLTPRIVNRSKCIAFLVSGKGKANILDKVIRGKYDPEVYPVQIIKNDPDNIHLFCDRDAIEQVLKNTA